MNPCKADLEPRPLTNKRSDCPFKQLCSKHLRQTLWLPLFIFIMIWGGIGKPLLVLATPVSQEDSGAYLSREDVNQFIEKISKEHRIPTRFLRSALGQARQVSKAIQLMEPAPEGTPLSWQQYESRFLDSNRIARGLAFWEKHHAALARASKIHGVPPEIIVAILGVETNYGKVMGNFRVIDTLATLAFDYPRRADFFRKELAQYLLFSYENDIDPLEIRGSFAGAIGLAQFMPSSIRRWGVDFNEDGQIDLQYTPEDAIGSIALFLKENGWRPHLPPRLSLQHPITDTIAQQLPSDRFRPERTLSEFVAHGIISAIPQLPTLQVTLVQLPTPQASTVYYLGTENFYALMRYNASRFYAMAVCSLAEKIERRMAATRPSAL